MKRFYKIGVASLGVIAVLSIFVYSFLGRLSIFLPHMVELTGLAHDTKNYLVVFQNNTEIRPTGGFITSYGILRFKYGIPSLELRDVYGDIASYASAPPDYHRELLENRWYKGLTFRDANTHPYFPVSASLLIDMYSKVYDDEIDGVVAINFGFLEDLVESMGEIEVDGEKVDKDKLFSYLEHSVSNVDKHDVKALSERKSALGMIKRELQFKMFNPFFARLVADQVADAIEKKDILFSPYEADDRLAKFVTKYELDGQNVCDGDLPSLAADYFNLSESNLGGAKSNRYIRKNVTYHLKENGEGADGRITIDVSHYGVFDAPLNTDYSGYYQLMLSKSAEIMGVKLNDEEIEFKHNGSESSPKSMASFIVKLPIGERARYDIEFKLGKEAFRPELGYTLSAPSQPGDNNRRLEVVVETAQGQIVSSDDFESREHIGFFNGYHDRNLCLKLKALPDKLPPRVVHQKIRDLQTIEIHFNEPVDGKSANNGFNYEIWDANVNDPREDDLSIKYVIHEGRFVTLGVEGMTNQNEEHYKVRMKNIYDVNGNMSEPNPKEITFVQRLEEEGL